MLNTLTTTISAAVCLLFVETSALVAEEIHVYEGESIQAAIDAAVDGDEIIVHPGTYFLDDGLTPLGKAIVLRGEDPTDPAIVAATVLDGGGKYNVLICDQKEKPDTVISGFYVTNGGLPGSAGGIYINDSSPTVSYCVMADNYNGGMRLNDSDARVINCVFTANTAQKGGGLSISYSSPVVMGCLFSNNEASSEGGGIRCQSSHTSGPALVVNCEFFANSSPYGGAAYNHGTTVDIMFIGCIFIENTALLGGGGMFTFRTLEVTATNCTFVHNSAFVAGGAMLNDYFATPVVTNCILWGNTPDQICDVTSATTLCYSDIEGGWDGYGFANIADDPGFVDPPAGEYRLGPGSPCIDAGVNAAVPADEQDFDEDGDTAERLPVDLDGNPRFADVEAAEDSGCGEPVVVDMGAYEHAGEVVNPVLIGDVDGDGSVDVLDLLGLLGAWGPCAVDCCLADLDFSGEVDVVDLLSLLGNWGP